MVFKLLTLWSNGHLVNEKPENWDKFTQGVQGIFNLGMETQIKNVDICSYHFNTGLSVKILKPLIDYIRYNAEANNNQIINDWQNIIKEGSNMLAAEFFDSILLDRTKINDIEANVNKSILSFGALKGLNINTMKLYHNLMLQKYGKQDAASFLKNMKETCELNVEVSEYITQNLYTSSPVDLNSFVSPHDNKDYDDEVRELGNNSSDDDLS
jgi:hypothetical protein